MEKKFKCGRRGFYLPTILRSYRAVVLDGPPFGVCPWTPWTVHVRCWRNPRHPIRWEREVPLLRKKNEISPRRTENEKMIQNSLNIDGERENKWREKRDEDEERMKRERGWGWERMKRRCVFIGGKLKKKQKIYWSPNYRPQWSAIIRRFFAGWR